MSILGLKLPTDPRWVNLAEKDLEEILIDHAFCEQKAATSCISMIVQFPDFEKVVGRPHKSVIEMMKAFKGN